MPLREKKLIENIRQRAPKGRNVVAGIGDDCAVLRVPAGHELLVTTDFSLENVHFRRGWHRPEIVGWRCLTRGLSDIAAVGGDPLACFLSLAVPANISQRWVDGFLDGLLKLAAEFHTPLAGGDTAGSTREIQADIIVLGSVPQGRAILRSGAKAGDQIYVTGELGESATAITRMSGGKKAGAEFARHFHPVPRIRAGQWLQRHGIPSAMIDISDGLSTDLEHICRESGVGAVIDAAAIPRAQIGNKKTLASLDLALHGGDDYELLFTSSRKVPSRIAGTAVTRIGEIVRGKGMTIVDGGRKRRLVAAGWEHFRK